MNKEKLLRLVEELQAAGRVPENPLLERGYFITAAEHNAAVDEAAKALVAEIEQTFPLAVKCEILRLPEVP